MKNAGDYNRRITIVRRTPSDDGEGFKSNSQTEVCKAWAKIKTTKGYTMVTQGSNFENATTGMEIRKPNVAISRKDIVLFADREWRIRYLNDIDEAGEYVELQVEEIRQNG